MTVSELRDALSLKVLAGEGAMEREIEGCYVGDLLSWVMGRAGENSAWITVMGNVNAVAVAKLADQSCMILCENAALDEQAGQQARENGVPVLSSDLPAYQLAVHIATLLGDAAPAQ